MSKTSEYELVSVTGSGDCESCLFYHPHIPEPPFFFSDSICLIFYLLNIERKRILAELEKTQGYKNGYTDGVFHTISREKADELLKQFLCTGSTNNIALAHKISGKLEDPKEIVRYYQNGKEDI